MSKKMYMSKKLLSETEIFRIYTAQCEKYIQLMVNYGSDNIRNVKLSSDIYRNKTYIGILS